MEPKNTLLEFWKGAGIGNNESRELWNIPNL